MGSIRTFDSTHYLRVLDPIASQASANTDWIQVFADANRAVFQIVVGAVGTSLAVKLTQAQDDAGTGAKDITSAALVTITNGGSNGENSICTIDIGPGDLDDKNGFDYVRCEVTATGTCVWGVILCLYDLRIQPPTQHSSYEQAVKLLS